MHDMLEELRGRYVPAGWELKLEGRIPTDGDTAVILTLETNSSFQIYSNGMSPCMVKTDMNSYVKGVTIRPKGDRSLIPVDGINVRINLLHSSDVNNVLNTRMYLSKVTSENNKDSRLVELDKFPTETKPTLLGEGDLEKELEKLDIAVSEVSILPPTGL